MSFKVDFHISLEDMIENAVENLKESGDNFTAYDVSKEIHELIRYKNIRQLIHSYLEDDIEIKRISSEHTVNGQKIPAISYGIVNQKTVSKGDRLIVKINGLQDGKSVYLVLLDDGRIALIETDLYRTFVDQYNIKVLAQYDIINQEVAVKESRISDVFPNGYTTEADGTTIYFEEV